MPSKEDLVKWGVDFFDITTGQVFDMQTLLYARSKGIAVVAASDVHESTLIATTLLMFTFCYSTIRT